MNDMDQRESTYHSSIHPSILPPPPFSLLRKIGGGWGIGVRSDGTGTELHLMSVVAHEEGRKGAMSTLTVGRIMRDFACLLGLEKDANHIFSLTLVTCFLAPFESRVGHCVLASFPLPAARCPPHVLLLLLLLMLTFVSI